MILASRRRCLVAVWIWQAELHSQSQSTAEETGGVASWLPSYVELLSGSGSEFAAIGNIEAADSRNDFGRRAPMIRSLEDRGQLRSQIATLIPLAERHVCRLFACLFARSVGRERLRLLPGCRSLIWPDFDFAVGQNQTNLWPCEQKGGWRNLSGRTSTLGGELSLGRACYCAQIRTSRRVHNKTVL